MRRRVAAVLASALFLTGCSQSFKESDPAGYEACIMLDRSRDESVNLDERIDMAVFRISEAASQSKTQRILDGLEPNPDYTELVDIPKFMVKDSLAKTCRDLGVPVRDAISNP